MGVGLVLWLTWFLVIGLLEGVYDVGKNLEVHFVFLVNPSPGPVQGVVFFPVA